MNNSKLQSSLVAVTEIVKAIRARGLLLVPTLAYSRRSLIGKLEMQNEELRGTQQTKTKRKEPNEKVTDIYAAFTSIFCETKTCVEKTNRLQLIL